MRKCLSCDIMVGGRHQLCPICHNPLSPGEDSPYMWPPAGRMKAATLLYKLQLFLGLALGAISLILDFILDVNLLPRHWSLIVVLWIVALELMLLRLIKTLFKLAGVFTMGAVDFMLLIMVTGHYFGYFDLCLNYICPIMIMTMLILNFGFSLADRSENSMVYLLGNILVGLIPYIVQFVKHGKQTISLPWTICMIISIVTFIGIAVFKGREVLLEIQKRLHV